MKDRLVREIGEDKRDSCAEDIHRLSTRPLSARISRLSSSSAGPKTLLEIMPGARNERLEGMA